MNGIEGMVKGGKEGLGKTTKEITLLRDIWGGLSICQTYTSETDRERAVNSAKYLKVLIKVKV